MLKGLSEEKIQIAIERASLYWGSNDNTDKRGRAIKTLERCRREFIIKAALEYCEEQLPDIRRAEREGIIPIICGTVCRWHSVTEDRVECIAPNGKCPLPFFFDKSIESVGESK